MCSRAPIAIGVDGHQRHLELAFPRARAPQSSRWCVVLPTPRGPTHLARRSGGPCAKPSPPRKTAQLVLHRYCRTLGIPRPCRRKLICSRPRPRRSQHLGLLVGRHPGRRELARHVVRRFKSRRTWAAYLHHSWTTAMGPARASGSGGSEFDLPVSPCVSPIEGQKVPRRLSPIPDPLTRCLTGRHLAGHGPRETSHDQADNLRLRLVDRPPVVEGPA